MPKTRYKAIIWIINSSLLLILTGCIRENRLSPLKKHMRDNLFNELSLIVKPSDGIYKISLSNKSYPRFNASIKNFTKDTIKIVLPGEGSESGRRTPIVRWSVVQKGNNEFQPDTLPEYKSRPGIAHCGNMNGLNMNQLITIAPNYKREIKIGMPYPQIPRKIGTYGVKFYYQHNPNSSWVKRGVQNSRFDGYNIIQQETKEIFLTSNELTIEVVE